VKDGMEPPLEGCNCTNCRLARIENKVDQLIQGAS